jgi:predicted secreted protein
MAKIKGNNVRLYIGGDLLAHTMEASFNFDTDTEEVTDADSGNWKENLPTLNGWSVDVTTWYNNAVADGADWADVMAAYLAQSELTLICELETGVSYTGLGYLTNLNPTGGTAGAYVQFSAGFIGTGEIS